MIECANTDVQDLLPEFAAEELAADARLEVELHLSQCSACRADVEVLRSVQQARPVPHAVNIAAIVAALPNSAAASSSAPGLRIIAAEPPERSTHSSTARRSSVASRWFRAPSLRMAAALMLVALGGLSVSIARRGLNGVTDATSQIALSETSRRLASGSTPYGSETTPVMPVVAVAPSVLPVQELSEYSEEELAMLMDHLNAWDGAPSLDALDESAPLLGDTVFGGGS